MTRTQDPTDAIRRKAVTFPKVAKGTSCTQSAFKAGKGTFLFIGPGPKGQGFKALFKLKASMREATKLAARHPTRFEVGSTVWVTTRFTADEPLPEAIWKKWLTESYKITCGATSKRTTTKRASKNKSASR